MRMSYGYDRIKLYLKCKIPENYFQINNWKLFKSNFQKKYYKEIDGVKFIYTDKIISNRKTSYLTISLNPNKLIYNTNTKLLQLKDFHYLHEKLNQLLHSLKLDISLTIDCFTASSFEFAFDTISKKYEDISKIIVWSKRINPSNIKETIVYDTCIYHKNKSKTYKFYDKRKEVIFRQKRGTASKEDIKFLGSNKNILRFESTYNRRTIEKILHKNCSLSDLYSNHSMEKIANHILHDTGLDKPALSKKSFNNHLDKLDLSDEKRQLYNDILLKINSHDLSKDEKKEMKKSRAYRELKKMGFQLNFADKTIQNYLQKLKSLCKKINTFKFCHPKSKKVKCIPKKVKCIPKKIKCIPKKIKYIPKKLSSFSTYYASHKKRTTAIFLLIVTYIVDIMQYFYDDGG